MKTSISSTALLSRSNNTVEAGRGVTISAIALTRGARLRPQISASVDPRHARQQILDLGLCGRAQRRARLALGAGGDHAAFLQHIFAHGEPRPGLLLVSDQR